MSDVQDDLLTIEGLAQRLLVSKNTIYSWVSRKRIPYIKLGRLIRFSWKEIQAWMEKNSRQPKF